MLPQSESHLRGRDFNGGDRNQRRVDLLSMAVVVATTAALGTVLPARGSFLADEARLYDGAVEVAETLRPAAVGPEVSGTSPQLVLPGGAAFDLFAVPFLFGRAPGLGSVFVLLLCGAGALVFDRALRRLDTPPALRAFAVALVCLSIWHARFADRLWNYHPFQLLTPALLWLAARLRTNPRSVPAILGFGFLSGVALQLNPTGILAIGVAGSIAIGPLARLRRRALPALALAGAAFTLAYLPYLLADAPHHFEGLRALIRDREMRPAFGREAWRSLLAIPAFASQSSPLRAEQPEGIFAPAVSFWIAVPLTLFGLSLPSPLRRTCWIMALLLPASFLLSGRDYMPHYTVALLPLCFVPVATALAFLWERGRLGSAVALGYLLAFGALGATLLTREYVRKADQPTLRAQLEVTDALLALKRPVRWTDDSMFDAPAIYEVLARRARGEVLRLNGPGPRAWLQTPTVASSLVVEAPP
jgi:hypothetical protein